MIETFLKIVYQRLFNWLIERINRVFQSKLKSSKTKESVFIGILDIFGFEVFHKNNFEQLCINYTNEMLQNLFNDYIFTTEQIEYEKEGIDWTNIDFPDNKECIQLFNDPINGLFSLLDQECIVPNGKVQTYLSNIKKYNKDTNYISSTSKQTVNQQFNITHYAGKVVYTTNDFIVKNKNKVHKGIYDILTTPEDNTIQIILNQRILKKNYRSSRENSFISKSVSYKFKTQVQQLVTNLKNTQTHYVRCIKPNQYQKVLCYEEEQVIEQLKFAGVLEVIKISKAGYPIRMPYLDFIDTFFVIVNSKKSRKHIKQKSKQWTETMLMKENLLKNIDYQFGKTKIFLKKKSYNQLQKKLFKYYYNSAKLIQKYSRRFLQYKYYKNLKSSTIVVQSLYRKIKAVKKIKLLRLERSSSIIIQTWWRCAIQTKKYKDF